ncbi:hypothetical protein GCM10010372_75990 [Streptomyces tauricus]|nr:hypothetical protein GCM10010372_75990 [Streptomyces tauricus]
MAAAAGRLNRPPAPQAVRTVGYADRVEGVQSQGPTATLPQQLAVLEAGGHHINASTARSRTPEDVATFLAPNPTQTKAKKTS